MENNREGLWILFVVAYQYSFFYQSIFTGFLPFLVIVSRCTNWIPLLYPTLSICHLQQRPTAAVHGVPKYVGWFFFFFSRTKTLVIIVIYDKIYYNDFVRTIRNSSAVLVSVLDGIETKKIKTLAVVARNIYVSRPIRSRISDHVVTLIILSGLFGSLTRPVAVVFLLISYIIIIVFFFSPLFIINTCTYMVYSPCIYIYIRCRFVSNI